MTSIWSVALAVLVLQFCSADGRRLQLGEDGFARVDSGAPSDPVSGITVSSWVNITQFPGGVAPIVTMISEDASYQIAFFIRHDGAGVLWGGPAAPPVPHDDYVDRHPRARFVGKERKRRNAVDYSMGLGDVMNIMTPRKERSNTWTPMNFVDVSEMGVADLETSGSSSNNHYENWYDVGYELQMQESAHPEPKIVTKPSGDNDFVVINWDGQHMPPLSTNQWDPVNHDLETPEFTPARVPTKIRAPDNEKFVWSQEDNRNDGGWTSQVIPFNAAVQKPSNVNGNVRKVPTSSPKTENPTTGKRISRPFVPDLTRRPSSNENVKTHRPAPDSFRYNTRRRRPVPSTRAAITTTTTTTTTTTPTRRPAHFSHEVIRNSQESRVPLWARLKKTSSEEKLILADTVTSTTEAITTSTSAIPTTRQVIPRVRATTQRPRPSVYRATTPVPKITTRLPVTSTRRPHGIISKTIVGTTTSKPAVVHKYKPQHIPRNSSERKTYNNDRKTYNNLNGKRNPTKAYTSTNRQQKPLMSHSLDEFKRIVEGKSTIKDTGNKVVVYSMPITDVEAYNRMYLQYQESESRQNPRINLQAVYDKAREGQDPFVFNEEESNQNRLEQVSEPLPVLTYKEEPLHYAEPIVAPIIVKESGNNAQITEKENPEDVSHTDSSSFRPLILADPYSTLEKDYSAYYPHVHKAEPVRVSTLNDQVAQSAEGPYTVRLPLAELVGALPALQQRPVLYELAVPAEQDIGGQQAGFYQEPSRISHEQLPPQYTQKPQTETKRVFSPKQSVSSNENRKHRPYVNSQEIRFNRNSAQKLRPNQNSGLTNQKIIYSSQDPLSGGMTPPSLPQPFHDVEQVRRAEEMIQQNYKIHNNRPASPQSASERVTEENVEPIKVNSVPVVANTPEIIKDIPLNVNFRKMPYNFDINTWYHITFTWNSFDHILRIYINGQLAGILEDTIPDKKTTTNQWHDASWKDFTAKFDWF